MPGMRVISMPDPPQGGDMRNCARFCFAGFAFTRSTFAFFDFFLDSFFFILRPAYLDTRTATESGGNVNKPSLI